MVNETAAGRSSPAGARPPTTVANYVTEAMRSGILEGRYPPGSRLDQQTLADELGASIIPVRESLRQLEAEGLVQITPRRGAFVVRPTDDEVREVYKVRSLLEGYATKEAVPRLKKDDLEELQSLADEMSRATHGNTYERWARVNREWHMRLYDAAELPLLLQIIGALWDRTTLTSHAYARDPGHRRASAQDHTRIMQAVRKGDADLAADLISQHIRSAMEDLLRGVTTAT
jgi:DNA-binding GntR family transcriptional regulator